MTINKVIDSFESAVKDVFDGAIILIGGFGNPGGCPTWLIKALGKQGAKSLTVVGNTPGFGRKMIDVMRKYGDVAMFPHWFEDGGLLVSNGQVKHAICSFPVSPSPLVKTAFEEALGDGRITVDLCPQGTLAERVRAAKMGIPAFYSPIGPGTIIEKGKELREFGGSPHVLEHAIKGDFSLIRAYKADRLGNLIFRGTSRSLNSTFAGASKITIAEVDEVVDNGKLDPERIVTPGIWVDRIVVRPEPGRTRKVQKW
ncbi:MAG: 3-oxoacid CoA-transferase subunit A [Desulfobacterales bacterium]